MTNKNEAWRLEDESGKKIGMKPSGDIKMFFGGKEVGTMQSISFANGSTIRPYALGSQSISTPIRGLGYERFGQEYLGHWTDVEETVPVRSGRFELEIPDIREQIYHEARSYERHFGSRPQYLSLNKKAYESLYVINRNEMPSRGNNEHTFMGIEMMCNPLQEMHVMALGSAIEEGVEGRLYRE